RELPPRGAERVHRRRERPRSLPRVVAAELGEVVAAFPLLHEHLPVGHFHRRDGEVRPALKHAYPVEPELETLRREERAILGLQPFDDEVFDDDRSPKHVDRQTAEMDRPLDLVGELPFGEQPNGRPEVDRQRRDDRGREDRERQLDRMGAEVDGPVPPDATLQDAKTCDEPHWITTSSAPASTDAPSTASSSPTTPSRAALSSFSIFMASTTTTVCRARTASPVLTPTRTTLPGIGATIR